MKTLIESTRQNWRWRRHRWWTWWRRSDRIPPLNGYQNGELAGFWRHQNQLLREGTVIWSSIVKANERLYRIGNQNLPAMVACDVDGSFDTCVDELDGLATELCQREVARSNPGRASEQGEHSAQHDPVSQAVHDDRAYTFGLPLPTASTGGRAVQLFTVLIYRPHLPARVLCGHTHLPCLFHPSCPYVMVLPSHAWPSELSEAWTPSDEQLEQMAAEEHQRRGFRRAGPVLEVTPGALKQFRELLKSGSSENTLVRVCVDGEHQSVMLTNEPLADDEVCKIGGLTFLVDSETAANHWGLRVGYQDSGGQAGFVVDS